jgi:hypothetical protein
MVRCTAELFALPQIALLVHKDQDACGGGATWSELGLMKLSRDLKPWPITVTFDV